MILSNDEIAYTIEHHADELTIDEIQALFDLAQRQEYNDATSSYLKYASYVHGDTYIIGKHIRYISDRIDKLLADARNSKNLIISIPPQHGKSMLVSETLPSYYLGKNPLKRVIVVSYGDDLARRFGRRNRQKIQEYGDKLFGISISRTSRSDTDFELDNLKGSLKSRGITAGITGQSADLIIIDDPIKNRLEADSETYRNRVWDEYLNSINTRLSSDGRIILIQTRWHEDDLAGRLLQYESGKWAEINIPLEAGDGDILGRQPGDPLFPEIGKDKAWLADYKQSYMRDEGTRAWHALMQGRPTCLEGNLLRRDWWQYYTTLPDKFDRVCMSWDCTFKDTESSDYVVGQVWGMIDIDCYLIDQVRDRMDFPTTLQAIKDLKTKHTQSTRIFVEDKANGSAVISILQKSISGIVPVNPEGGKVARVNAISHHIESGHVWLPLNAPFTNDFVNEASQFPNGKHDDQVDALSQGINRMMYYRSVEREEIPYVQGGVYARKELISKGFRDYQITQMVKDGKVKLIGR